MQETIGQVKPPPPPPPPDFEWTPPSTDERMNALAKRNCTLDELLYPLNYYKSEDYIFFGTPDSILAAKKIRKAYFQFTGLPADAPSAMYYIYYDKSGRMEQSAVKRSDFRDSIVHKWKYDNLGRMKCYVTLTYEIYPGGKSKMRGDSVVVKYNAFNLPTEVTRYSVTGTGTSRNSSFISKDTYTYNANNKILTKSIDGYRYNYKYDKEQRVSRIECKATYDAEIYTIDSFAWKKGTVTDTLEHWAVESYDHERLLMDRQVINSVTGQELEYSLYPEEKVNFYRDVYGAIRLSFTYDAAFRLIKMTETAINGMIVHERTYSYSQDGISMGFQSMILHDPETDQRPLPPAATNFNGKLYVANNFQYIRKGEGLIPEEVEIKGTLIGIKGDSREILAHGTGTGKLNLVCEYYQ